MHETVLIATDGSEEVERAVNYGIDLAEAFDAEVHVLYVVETEATYILTVGLSDKDMEEYEEYGEEAVTGVVERATDRGLDGRGTVRKGRVAEEIVEYAEDNEIGTIIMGQRGRGATIDKYLGSTAEKVMRMTDIPVTAIGPDSE
jgi:nucleotide-binding universal stress UspA family protein